MTRHATRGVSTAGTQLILAAVGIAMVVAGATVLRPARIADPRTTTGTVVSVDVDLGTSRKGRSTTTYTPVVQFEVDGATHTIDGQVSTSSVAAGDTVEVTYSATDPGTARWGDASGGWTWIGVCALGVVLAGLAGFRLVAARAGTARTTPGAPAPAQPLAAPMAPSPMTPSPMTPSPMAPSPMAASPMAASPAPSPSGAPAPGWYPDPSGAARQRWWDGTTWTGHTA